MGRRPAYGEGMNATGHLRRAVRGHQHLADAAIALAVFAATVLTTFAGHPAAATSANRSVAIPAVVIGCGALVARRRCPLGVLAVSAVAAEVFLAEAGTTGVLILLAPSIALYTVADLVERRRGLIIGGSALASLAVMHALMKPALLGPQNLAFTALGALAIAAGDSSRNRRAYLAEVEHRAARAELDRELTARRQVAEERLRIARDLHDSVGHHLALISVQSQVAGQLIDQQGGAAHQALAHVSAASRKALEELRDTISLLRQPGDPVAPTTTPAPGLDALDDLLGSLRASGLGVEINVEGAVVALAPSVDLTAFRVIQESLTNVCKHSIGRRARLALVYDRQELRLTVEDLGCDPGGYDGRPDDSAAGRHGIVGMRERVLALGGSFAAGPRPGGAFRVTAALPYRTPHFTGERAG